jgi:hypothetical protein
MAILKIEPQVVDSAGDFTFNSAVVTANVSAGNVAAGGFYWANGAPFVSSSYGNADVAAYLPTDSVIIGINANVAGANAAIVTANTAMKSYVDARDTSITNAWTANAGAQADAIAGANAAIITANSAVVSYVDTLNSAMAANVTGANAAIVAANTAMKLYVDARDTVVTNAWTANAGAQADAIAGANAAIITANSAVVSYVDTLNAAMASNVAGANAAIVTANSAVVSYVNTLNAAMASNVAGANTAIVTANSAMKLYVDAVTTNWTANAASQEAEISGLRANIIAANSAITSTTINLAGTTGTGSVANGGTLTFGGTYGVTATASSSTITIGTPQDLRTTASPTFYELTTTGNVNIAGKLTVANLEARGSINVVVQDPLLYLQSNVLYPWIYDTGIFSDSIGGPSNVYVHHGMVRSIYNGYWGFFSNVASEPDANVNWNDAGIIWDKIKAGSLILANNTVSTSTITGALVVSGGIGVAGNVFSGAVYTDTYNYANGVSILSGVYSSIAGANAAIVTANTAMKSYVDAQDTAITNAWTANAGVQADAITGANAAIVTANSAVVSYVNTLNAAMASNVAGANAAIVTANSAMKNYVDAQSTVISSAWTANAGAQADAIAGANAAIVTANSAVVSYVNTLNAAMASNVAGANAAIVTANSAVVSYVNTLNSAMASNVAGANAAIVTANTAMKSYVDAQNTAITSAWTANAGVQADAIALKAPIASPTFTGTVTTPALSVTANTSTGNILAGGYFWANGTPFASSNYGNTDVEAYLPISTVIATINSNIAGANAAIITANTGMKSYVDAQFTAAGGYGNTQVGAYLTVYGGNVLAANITATGNIVGGGVRTTTSASAPSNPTVGDIWYSTTDNTTLRYTNDGSSSFWLDIGGPTSAANAIPLGTTVESYLTASPTIAAINANVTGANAAIVTANSAVVSYVNTLNSAMASNVAGANAAIAGANAAIITANTALKSYVDAQDGTKAPTASPTFTGTVTAPILSITGNATLSGNILQQQAYYETYGNITNSGGNLTCNFNLGAVFYVTSLTANVTASFTNVNALTGTVTATTLIIDQGATAYRISNIQINGVSQTIRWVGTTAHTGTASNTDIVSFSLIHLGGGTYRVLGQSSSYG